MPFNKKNKAVKVRIEPLEKSLAIDLEISVNTTGAKLFEDACRTIGLRETWYFGLQYIDDKENRLWLRSDKKVLDQNPVKLHFDLLVKFYPEDVTEELIQEVTKHLFFLQVKQSILNCDSYCPPEASVLLASYAVQARYGDYDEVRKEPEGSNGPLAIHELLPQKVMDQYQMTPEMWDDRIKIWYSDHQGMTQSEAELEYLKIAQDLDMYGVHYFPIKNKKDSDLWLGVTSLGLNIHDYSNKMQPKTTFPWSEIRHISFVDKKFTIKPVQKNAPNFIFYSQKVRMNKSILDLCIGNHSLFMKRRQPESIEVLKMKDQAREEKARLQLERSKLMREKQLREQAERDKAEIERRLLEYQEEVRLANEALRKSEASADFLAQKSKLAEEEASLCNQKAQEAQKEVNKVRLTAMRTEEEKRILEQKTREAEQLSARLVDESERRVQEANRLREELNSAKNDEKQAKDRLLAFLARSYDQTNIASRLPSQIMNQCPSPSALSNSSDTQVLQFNCDSTTSINMTTDGSSYDIIGITNDLKQSMNVEMMEKLLDKETMDIREKNKMIEGQLRNLRNEFVELNIGEKSELDIIYDQQVRLGENKYSTLRKVTSGSTRSRVEIFEKL